MFSLFSDSIELGMVLKEEAERQSSEDIHKGNSNCIASAWVELISYITPFFSHCPTLTAEKRKQQIVVLNMAHKDKCLLYQSSSLCPKSANSNL